ncbi:hypothetical protein B484DRAFT_406332 [Ochromonadaceae sp. CCMP2298]|nr:hypothetical protein B484DRAFT_406332 [Ochromonadaceae sp. CCMP2298]
MEFNLSATLDDVNLDGAIAAAKLDTDATERSYKTYKDKFRKFMKLPKDAPILPEHLTDRIIAAFFHALGNWGNHMPYHLKTGSAAVGSELVRSKLPGLYKQASHYPDTHIVVKISPHYANKATGFSLVAMGAMLGLSIESHQDLQTLTIVVVACWTGLRMQDIHRLKERCLTLIGQGPDDEPRRWQIRMDVAKNDRDGTHMTEEQRTVLVPCLCHQELTKGKADKFKALVDTTPATPCLSDCPYALLCRFQETKPSKRAESSKSKADVLQASGELSFARALSAQGGDARTFTVGNLGINELGKMPEIVNQRLPEEMRTERKATGHSGRHTLVSNGVNSGVIPAVVAITSKYKGVDTLLGYVKPNNAVLLATSLGIGKAMARSIKGGARPFASSVENSEAEEEEEAEVEWDKENMAGASTPMPILKGQGKGTPGRGEKRQRVETPLRAKVKRVDTPVGKRVRFEDTESSEDQELQRVTEENAKISIVTNST